jgi:hypothetical protein
MGKNWNQKRHTRTSKKGKKFQAGAGEKQAKETYEWNQRQRPKRVKAGPVEMEREEEKPRRSY